jgi:drug/metabolite transporter (DMT)-like permease
MKTRLDPTLAVALASILWGLYWVPVRGLQAAGMDALSAAGLLNLTGLAILLPFLFRQGRPVRSALPAGIMVGAAMTAYSVALGLTSVVNAVLLFYLTPLWSTLIGLAFHGDRLTLGRVGALAASLIGLWLILGDGHGLPIPRNMGDFAALAAGLIWSVASFRIFGDSRSDVRSLTFWTLLSGALLVAALLPFAGFPSLDGISAGSSLFPAILGGGMMCLLLILTIWGARKLPPARVGILLMGEIVVGVVSAALFAGEVLSIREIAGALAIVMAAGIEVLGALEKKSEKSSGV